METIPSQQSAAASPAPQVSNFCIILHKDGQVDRLTGRTLEEYVSIVKDAGIAWIDWTTEEQEKALESAVLAGGFSKIPVSKLIGGFYSAYEDHDTELGIMLPAVSMKNETMMVHRLVILIRDKVILTIHSVEVIRLLRLSRYAPQFLKRMEAGSTADRITQLLERIIDENNDRNFEYLREIETRGDEISKSLIEEKVSKKKVAHNIYRMKHVLIDYLNVLWATKDVIESLRYGDSDLITNDERLLGRIGMLSDNIDRHIGLSEQMSTMLASGLEVMQSIYNNQLQSLNNRFALVTAYLTVLGTAFLVPNTLATIAGSGVMEGKMAAQWWYMPMLIVSTLIATAVSFLWVLHVWKKREEEV